MSITGISSCIPVRKRKKFRRTLKCNVQKFKYEKTFLGHLGDCVQHRLGKRAISCHILEWHASLSGHYEKFLIFLLQFAWVSSGIFQSQFCKGIVLNFKYVVKHSWITRVWWFSTVTFVKLIAWDYDIFQMTFDICQTNRLTCKFVLLCSEHIYNQF